MATAAAADFRAHFVSVQNAARAADPTAPLLTGEELMENADDSATDEIVTKWVAVEPRRRCYRRCQRQHGRCSWLGSLSRELCLWPLPRASFLL